MNTAGKKVRRLGRGGLFGLLMGVMVGLAGPVWAEPAQPAEPDDPAEVAAEAESAPGADLAATVDPGTETDEPAAGDGWFGAAFDKVAATREIGLILVLLSVIGLAAGLERAFALRRSRFAPEGLGERVLQAMRQRDFDEAQRLAEADPSLLADVARAVIEHKRFAYADLSAVAGDVATRGLRQAQQRAFPLALVATLSPLLGLLGTVIGMIGAFDAVALAGSLGDASVMAGEISYALVTTAMGLIVAVPALAAYHLVKARTTSLATSLDQQASEMINGWHQQRMTWKRSNRDAPRPRPRDAARADASASAASGPVASSPAVGPAPPTSGGSDHA